MTKEMFLNRVGLELGQELAIASPKDTSTLAQSFMGAMRIEGENIIFTVPDYFKNVHYGTRAHEIRPKDKKALYWKGAKHPVKVVRHPGTAANPFLLDVLNRKFPDIVKRNIHLLFK